MIFNVRIGHPSDYNGDESKMVTLDFGDDTETAFKVIEVAVTQGYVVKAGMRHIDG